MKKPLDPFMHHPELRDEIADPMKSFMRTFTTDDLAAKMAELGLPLDWWHPDEKREAMRAETLATKRDSDLWVFGYGSLMWDPGLRFAEVRRAHVPAFARQFILKDIYGGRGTVETPGLMVALDEGAGCDGLLLRIEHAHIEEESEVLWRREMIGPAYKAVFVEAVTAGETMSALTFVADHDADLIDAGLTREEQIRCLATGTGFMGSSFDYLKNVAAKLDQLGIKDENVSALLRDTEGYLAART